MRAIIGTVVSIKMDKTIIVSVVRSKIHPLYKKILKKIKRYKVHSTDDTVKVGDKVQIVSTRPISKDKHHKLLKKL